MNVKTGCFVKDIEMDRLGYTVAYDDELKCFGVSFKDEPMTIYWMEEKQLEVVEYEG